MKRLPVSCFCLLLCQLTVSSTGALDVGDDGRGGDELDLFVQQVFIKYDENGIRLENSTLECSTCEEKNGCIVGLRFHIPSECDLTEYGDFQGVEYAPPATTNASGAVCLTKYKDDTCTIPITGTNATATTGTTTASNSSLQQCSEHWMLDECSVFDDNGYPANQVVTRLPNWCIRSSHAQDDFVVQMVRQRQYDSMEDCQAGNTERLSWTGPLMGASKDTCFREPIDALGSTKLAGSVQTYCEGSILKAHLFSDQSCSNQTHPLEPRCPALNFTLEECSNPFLACGYDWDFFNRIADCNTPTLFCKEVISHIPYASKVNDASGSVNEPPPPVEESNSSLRKSLSGRAF